MKCSESVLLLLLLLLLLFLLLLLVLLLLLLLLLLLNGYDIALDWIKNRKLPENIWTGSHL